jgi:hypothetical protein
MIALLMILSALQSSVPQPKGQITLPEIREAHRTIHCESCPAGRLKAFVDFRLAIEGLDPAIGSDYFPISDLTGKPVNLTRWREESFRSGQRYKQRVVYPVPQGFKGPLPGAFDQTVAFDGTHSWRYRPDDRNAERFDKVTAATQIVEDYFGDMIGSRIPVASVTMSRTVAAPSDEPYDLDQVLASDLYEVVGTETVAGERCTIIERAGHDRIWLANDKAFAVVRREWRWSPGGPLKRRIANEKFQAIGRGAWLPYVCRMEIFSHPVAPRQRRVGILTATVEEASIDFRDSEFEPNFVKGTNMVDAVTGSMSIVGYTEAELEAVKLRKQKIRKPALPIAFEDSSPWRRRVPMILGALTISVLLAFIYSRLRSGGDK